MKIGDIFKVDIIDEDNIGNGIAKIDDLVVFVSGGFKGDILSIEITSIKKKYANAKINKVIFPSNNRIVPKCKYYNSCGGCTFLHTTYKNERKIKQKYIEKLFNRKIEYMETKNELNYRNKITLHVKDSVLGLYNENTHNICEIDNCLLINPKIASKMLELKRFDLSTVSEIMIRCINDKIVISVQSTEDDINIKNIKCDSLYINDEYIKGEEYLIDEIDEFKFSIYPESFYQVNKEGMINIYNKARSYLKSDDTLLDLYCGTGTIGIWMADKFNSITGVEINKSSIKNANINKELNNINNIEFICRDAKDIKKHYDAIIVDPPRNGLSNSVTDYLNYSDAKQIIYISCNPNTLKRDADLLTKYEVKELSCADMFPRTKHIECVCLLERR